MDDLLKDFLTETTEHIEGAESQLVQFERNPHDAALLASIFRLLHTIKGTSSFLGLVRLEHVAHAAENVIAKLREGAPPTPETVSLTLAAIDRIKQILAEVEKLGAEPEGSDADLTDALDAHANGISTGSPSRKKKKKSAAAQEDGPACSAAEPAAPLPAEPNAAAATDGQAPAVMQGEAKPEVSEPAKGKGAARQTQHGTGTGTGRSAETVRVTVDTIERIMQLVSELVLTRNQLLEITRHREEDTVKTPLQRLSALTTDLQDAVMRARMQPVGRLFANLPRLVRELAGELGKKIELVTEGDDTELDRQLIEVLRDPLTHLIRNCADHGIEPPETRRALGKPETGEIRVSAAHEAGQITIVVSDDGRGLDAERLRKKLVGAGLVSEQDALKMSEDELFPWIFEAGVSTAQQVTNVSGRGVGMDVVRANIESIGGTVMLSSKPGCGTRFTLHIPLTLAIAPALIIEVADQRFALPQHSVVEAVGIGADSPHAVETVQNALVLRLRNEVIPIADLRAVLGLPQSTEEETPDRLVVVMRVGGEAFGLMVDGVADVQEIVVKPLNGSLAHLRMFSGQTILGDGSVVLILDPAGIATKLGIEKTTERRREAARETQADADRTRLILFRAGGGALKVLPLSLVARIEVVAASAIEKSDDGLVTLHQGSLMPIVPVTPLGDLTDQAYPVLVLSVEGSTVGLLVDEIVDIVEEKLEIQLLSSAPQLVGSAEIRGKLVELIDIAYFLRAAQKQASSVRAGEPHRILLIDGDRFFRDSLAPSLAAAGYRVAAAASVPEALRLAEKGGRFDAILVDGELAQAEGQKGLSALRHGLGEGEAPLVALLSHTSSAPTRSPEVLGVAAVAAKLDRQAVLAALASALEASSDGAFARAERLSAGMAA